MKNILIVCTGNVCRSPMASALLQQRLAGLGLAGQVQVESAGTWAMEGQPASLFARATLAERGLSLDGHLARSVTEAMLNRADLVIVMAEEHRRSLFRLSMRNLHKIFLLSEFSGKSAEITDPMGGTREEYTQTARDIDQWFETGMPQILKQLRLQPSTGDKVAG